jgi:hypothetical protein
LSSSSLFSSCFKIPSTEELQEVTHEDEDFPFQFIPTTNLEAMNALLSSSSLTIYYQFRNPQPNVQGGKYTYYYYAGTNR